jgi:anti-sigma regulatory factor (Ser/Thr protein kinase)
MEPRGTNSPGTTVVTLRGDLLEIPRVHGIVEELARTAGLSEADLNAINVSLDEILTNIIQHGFDDTGEHCITVRVAIDESHQATVEIEDDGRPFDPLEAKDPVLDTPIEERPIGGLGIHLVKHLMDAVEYRRHEGHNLLVLRRLTRE